jgi:type I restriction enzyme M protein
MKDGPKNRLRDCDIHKIVDVFNRRDDSDPKYARTVSIEEIEKNDFNLNIPRYIDSQQAEDIQDIEGHLKGGIPSRDVDALDAYWQVGPQLRQALFTANRPGYVDLATRKQSIKATIYEHPEFVAYIADMNGHFAAWRQRVTQTLKALQPGCHPKTVIHELAEDLLAHYAGKPLIDRYAVFQHLMDYWSATMQDDCYLIAADGWKAETTRIVETNKKGKEVDKGWTCDLIPKPLIVARYFAAQRAAIREQEAALESIAAQIAEMEEEHGGEEGLFAELDKVTKANVTARLKEIKSDPEAKDEAAALNAWLNLCTQEADLKKALKEAEYELDASAYAQYPKLSDADIKALVVDDKWLAAIDADIHSEMDRISQTLTQRVKELAERYETSLPTLTGKVADLSAKVALHLKKMGFQP